MMAAREDSGPVRERADNGVELCSMQAGTMRFGVPILRIVEILGAPGIRSVPLAPVFIGGLVHYRGEVLTVVSLRRLLDLEAHEAQSDVVVLEGAAGCFGLLVDSVIEVITAEAEAFEPNPSTLEDRLKGLFAGTCKLEDGLLVMLDPDRLDPMRLVGAAG